MDPSPATLLPSPSLTTLSPSSSVHYLMELNRPLCPSSTCLPWLLPEQLTHPLSRLQVCLTLSHHDSLSHNLFQGKMHRRRQPFPFKPPLSPPLSISTWCSRYKRWVEDIKLMLLLLFLRSSLEERQWRIQGSIEDTVFCPCTGCNAISNPVAVVSHEYYSLGYGDILNNVAALSIIERHRPFHRGQMHKGARLSSSDPLATTVEAG